MAFFTSITATILKPAEETKTTEGVEVYEVKGVCQASKPGIPVVMLVDKDSEQGKFLKGLADLTKGKKTARVLVSGVIQTCYAQKSEDGTEIEKPSKVIVYVGAARRLRLQDTAHDPEQAIIFGSGFAEPQTDFNDKSKRIPQLQISGGTQDFKEEGKYSSKITVIGDNKTKTDEVCLRVEEGQEVYFMANLYRSEGEMRGKGYDNIKASVTFIEEGDRIKQKRGGKRNHSPNLSGQLSDTFEEASEEEEAANVNQLAEMAGIALGDF